MTFTSLFFILIIFPFFLIFSLFDHSAEYKNMILIITSLLFFVWGKPVICLVMLLSFVPDFIFGIFCGKKYPGPVKIIALIADLVFNISFYCAVNFTDFSQNFRTGNNTDMLFPLFSAVYFTRGFSYVYDVFCENIKAEKNIFCLMTYMINFQLLTPITMVRYKDISAQIRERKSGVREIKNGAFLSVSGLAKCVILAETMQIVYGNAQNGYALDSIIKNTAMLTGIYFYLTGIADMSEGMGLISGFKYPRMYRDFNAGKGLCSVFFGFGKGINNFVSEIAGRIFKNKYAIIFFSIIGVFVWYKPSPGFAVIGTIFGLFAMGCLYFRGLSRLRGVFRGIGCLAAVFFVIGGIRFTDFTGYINYIKSCFENFNISHRMLECLELNLLVCLFTVIYFTVYYNIKRFAMKFFAGLEGKSEKGFVTASAVRLLAVSVLLFVCIVTISQGGITA